MDARLELVAFDAADIGALVAFYTELTGWPLVRSEPDWMVVRAPDGQEIAFQAAVDHVPPQWPAQEHPQQFHLDLLVSGHELAAWRAIGLGATRLAEGSTWITLTDPAGHPFDLWQREGTDLSPRQRETLQRYERESERIDKQYQRALMTAEERQGELVEIWAKAADEMSLARQTHLFAVTIDAPDAAALAQFYADLLGMSLTCDGPGGALIEADGWRLMFQQVSGYNPPQWPDPAHPQQAHLDIRVDDLDGGETVVRRLGAAPLSAGGDRYRVFADPAGHPFCLTL